MKVYIAVGALIYLVAFAVVQTPIRAQSAAVTIWSGVYTDAQAKRGATAYKEHCMECHGATLAGQDEAPGLTGSAFMANWNGLTMGDLYDRIRLTMPPDNPGKLSPQQVADVLAHVLAFNKFPAGKAELARQPEMLKQIQFKPFK